MFVAGEIYTVKYIKHALKLRRNAVKPHLKHNQNTVKTQKNIVSRNLPFAFFHSQDAVEGLRESKCVG